MTWAAVIVGGIGATAGAVSSNQAAGAASDAAGAQQDAANLSYADQLKLNAQNRRDSQPYRDSGLNALNQLNYLMGLGGTPTEMAHTQDNFDADKYKAWRIEQMTAQVMNQFKNPDKQAKIIAKRTADINAKLSDEAKIWADYKKRSNAAPNKTSGEFWDMRDPEQGVDKGGQSGTEFGFLQKRFNNDEFEKDSGYQFRMNEGARAVDAGASARNGLLSGAAMKAMLKYGQGFASNEYGNAYNRFTGDQGNMYNRLAGISGTGQQQMNETQQRNQQGMNAAGGYMQNAADAKASGIAGAENARQSGYEQIGNVLTDAITTYANKPAAPSGGTNTWGGSGSTLFDPTTGKYG